MVLTRPGVVVISGRMAQVGSVTGRHSPPHTFMSLDSVEIVMGWEGAFGISITDADAEVLRTLRQSMDLIATKLAAQDETKHACLSLRAFHRLRHSIIRAASVGGDRVRPDARLRDLVNTDRQRTWEAVAPVAAFHLCRVWAGSHRAPSVRSQVGLSRTLPRLEDFEYDHDFIRDIGID